jgi:PAS domain S-box-containing protein
MVLIAVDQDLNITRWNRFSEKIYGISQASALGKNILEVLPVFAREHLEQYVKYVLKTGNDYTASDFEHISKKSYSIYITLKIVPIKSEEEVSGAVVFVDNITARKLAEEALRLKNHELGIINSITSTINRTKNMAEMIGLVLSDTLELLNMDIGAVYLFSGEGSQELYRQKVVVRTPAGHSITCKDSVTHTAAIVTDQIYCGRRSETVPGNAVFENHHDSVSVPLSVKNKLLGIMVPDLLRVLPGDVQPLDVVLDLIGEDVHMLISVVVFIEDIDVPGVEVVFLIRVFCLFQQGYDP